MPGSTSHYFHPPQRTPVDVASTPDGAAPLPAVIVGAGPVGMGVALGLAHRGIRVTVLEAADRVSFGSRAICISRHSLEVAHRLGFGAELEELVLPWYGGRSFYRDREVLRFRMPSPDSAVRGPMVNVSQSEIEEVMADALEAHPLIDLHWSAEVTGAEQSGGEVALDVATPFGERRLRASWAVAADGGRSRLRSLLGLRMEGNSYEGSYVIADIHWPSELPAERMVWFDPPSNPGSTIIMHRQPNDIWRIDYQLDAGDDAEEETREERVRERIRSHLDWLQNDVPWTLEWQGFYRAHALALRDFVHGRTVFAGDAAHLVPIFGVRGLNSGMEDAETLSWQLAAVISGGAAPSLLDAYSAERHAAWQQNVANAGKSTLIMSPGGAGHRTTRDAVLALAAEHDEFSHLVNPRQSSATEASSSPLTWLGADSASGAAGPGEPVEDRRVRTADGQEAALFSVLGGGFAVVGAGVSADGAAELSAAAEQLAAALAPEQVRAVAIPAGPGAAMPDGVAVLEDADGAVAAAFGAEQGAPSFTVVRPDGLILCRVSGLAELDAVAAHLKAGTAPEGGAAAEDDAASVSSGPAPGQSADEYRREEAWLALSEALENAGDDREALLARLALLLADRTDPATFRAALEAAAKSR